MLGCWRSLQYGILKNVCAVPKRNGTDNINIHARGNMRNKKLYDLTMTVTATLLLFTVCGDRAESMETTVFNESYFKGEEKQ